MSGQDVPALHTDDELRRLLAEAIVRLHRQNLPSELRDYVEAALTTATENVIAMRGIVEGGDQ
jgi:hypothetical protein